MSWSRLQQKLFVRAASQAGLADGQRYVVMRHVGCPNDGQKRRPSVKHPRNTNEMFEQAMAILESQAAQVGGEVRPPREVASWRLAAQRSRDRMLAKARAIVREAVERLPEEFDAGLEQYIVEHTTDTDDGELVMVSPMSLEECDGGQLHRVIEALRAYVGREFALADITPKSFTIPPSVHARLSKQPRARQE